MSGASGPDGPNDVSGGVPNETTEARVRRAFADQATRCDALGSPFTARLMRVLGADLDRTTRTGRTILDWRGVPDARGDAVPLRLAAGLHALARRGAHPALAAAWPLGPPGPPGPVADDAALARVVASVLADADEALHAWLARPPQTNEVARAAVLYPGLMAVAARTGLPLALFELGASAGLNLVPERYAYRLGGRNVGDPASAVRLEPGWRGSTPAGDEPVVVERRGCDRAPLDARDAADRERLLACTWPDQRERLARLEAALDVARGSPPAIERADAADWVEERLAPVGPPGVARVLFHSIAAQYFPADAVRRIDARVRACGRAATRDAPFARLAFEQDGDAGAALSLTAWPGGDTRVLARSGSHVRDVDWHG